MKIIHIAAELSPIAKVGGLGDVVQGLSYRLHLDKQDTSVIIPFYKNLKKSFLKDLKILKKDFNISYKNRFNKNAIYQGTLNGIKVYLIKPKNKFFEKEHIYGYKNDCERFLYFCKTSCEFLKRHIQKADIVHIHDWHTSFIAPLLKDTYSKENLSIKGIVLSIHNLMYQGHCPARLLKDIGIDHKKYLQPNKLQDPKHKRTINLLKGGIVYSDFIVPVSKTYAKEILTKKLGCSLESLLKKYKRKIKGIVNGIEKHTFNPKCDKLLKNNYSCTDPIKKIIKIKNKNKKLLRKKLNLNQKDLPIVANIGRLVDQKGPELIKHALIKTLELNGQFIILGTPFNKKMDQFFNSLKKQVKNNKNASINFHYDEALSHLIFAASDFIIVPSLFEPCGLTQIIAFKYGAIPIVRKTGGLADTVFDIDDKKIAKNKKNGFVFKDFSKKGVESALKRALKFWQKKDAFYKIIKKNMQLDFCWDKSLKEYLQIYKKLLK